MSEKKLYQDFKEVWPFYIERIEPKNEIGIPDCHLVNKRKVDIFLELKYMNKKFKEAVLPIKKTQFIWHAKYSGNNSYMLFQVEDDYFLFKRSSVIFLKGRVNYSKFIELSIANTKRIEVIVDILRNV